MLKKPDQSFPRYLWLIEAPGKIDTFRSLIMSPAANHAGGRVIATKWRLYANPRYLSPLALEHHPDKGLVETHRKAVNVDLFHRLCYLARRAEVVFVCTDPDEEGEVIAHDIARLLRDAAPDKLSRVRIYRLDEPGFRDAMRKRQRLTLDHTGPDGPGPGTLRRIVDRYIGGVYSDMQEKRYVGRAQCALMAWMYNSYNDPESQPEIGTLTLTLPAPDDGEALTCTIPLKASTLDAATHLLNRHLNSDSRPPLMDDIIDEMVPQPLPCAAGPLMVACAKRLRAPVGAVASSMQKAYENGRLSYCRAEVQALGREAIEVLSRLGTRVGLKPTALDLSAPPQPGPDGIESPRPLTTDFDISRALGLLPSLDEAVLSCIARRQLMALLPRRVQRLSEEALPAHLRGKDLTFSRSKTPYPWRHKRPENRVQMHATDILLMQCLLDSGMGRPGTWAYHIKKALRRALFHPDGQLNDKGAEWLSVAPEPLRNLSNISDMNQQIQNFKGSPEQAQKMAFTLLEDYGLYRPVAPGQTQGNGMAPIPGGDLPDEDHLTVDPILEFSEYEDYPLDRTLV